MPDAKYEFALIRTIRVKVFSHPCLSVFIRG